MLDAKEVFEFISSIQDSYTGADIEKLYGNDYKFSIQNSGSKEYSTVQLTYLNIFEGNSVCFVLGPTSYKDYLEAKVRSVRFEYNGDDVGCLVEYLILSRGLTELLGEPDTTSHEGNTYEEKWSSYTLRYDEPTTYTISPSVSYTTSSYLSFISLFDSNENSSASSSTNQNDLSEEQIFTFSDLNLKSSFSRVYKEYSGYIKIMIQEDTTLYKLKYYLKI